MATDPLVAALDRANLLETPSAVLTPGGHYTLVYQKGLGPFDEARFLDWLNATSGDVYPVSAVYRKDDSIGVTVRGMAQPKHKTVGLASQSLVRCVPQFADAILTLTYWVDAAAGKLENTTNAASHSPKASFNPLGLKDLFGDLSQKLGFGIKSLIVALVLVAVIVLALKYRGRAA